MINSNKLKTVPYPSEFTEEDKLKYDILYSQAKVIHADIEKENPFIIHISIIGHIRLQNGLEEPFTDEELEAVKKSYELKSKVIECNEPEDHYIYNKEKNPMYFPATLSITSEEKEEQVIINT